MTQPSAVAPSGQGPTPRAVVARALLRIATSVTVLLVLYYVLPFTGAFDSRAAFGLLAGLLFFLILVVWEVRSITRATYPVIRAVETLATLVPLFLLLFATYYCIVSDNSPSSFSSQLTRTDALYFTVTVFATVGFGDVTAQSQATRVAVTVQMVSDLLVLGVLLRVVVTAAQRSRQRRTEEEGGAIGDGDRP